MIISIALSATVPLWINKIKEKGGISEEDIQRCQSFATILGSKGDHILYKSKKPGETARIFNDLAYCIAVMSYAPGGISIFGQHYESK